MHELSVAEAIIKSLEKLKDKEGFKILNRVDISIGELSGVNVEALKFAIDSIKSDTILRDATINLNNIPVKLRCLECGNITDVKDYTFKCDKCGSDNIEFDSGETVEITEIEVD
jgi:hydrogenase nickel incorporation protein HypA/HybF